MDSREESKKIKGEMFNPSIKERSITDGTLEK